MLALNKKIEVATTVAASFGCPFEGEISTSHLLSIINNIAKIGLTEICLADTIGVATPKDIKTKLRAISSAFPHLKIRLHLHNTRNTGIANAWAGLEEGVVGLESSFGGAGGCPFAPKATGNIPTEDLLYMLDRSGVKTGISLKKSIEAANWLEKQLGRTLPGLLKITDRFPPL
jgi:hydroxymethylglutaryl-CoA lyase